MNPGGTAATPNTAEPQNQVNATGTGGTPKAVVPEDQVNFGDVPVVTDMNGAKVKRFVIKNEGTADLKLSDGQVKTLEGC